MEIDFKALAAGLIAAALMAFGAHAHSHRDPGEGAKAPEVRPAPPASEAAR